jgi:sulfur-carrier protein adenylyltransferase/sulfurtransferase
LLASRVFITGAGGLGSPAALYLAAAGVGCITLVDDDVVERSNLQRQILHSDHLVGHLKTESAAQRLHALNPDIEIRTVATRLEEGNVDELLAGHDVILDGSDNFPTRYLLNDACIRLGLPLVYGAVLRFAGQVAVFHPAVGEGPCYRCLFPEPPLAADSPSCAEAGVLGVMPGVIGTLQATEALKLLLGIGQPLIAKLVHFDALTTSFRTTRLVRDPECRSCGNRSRPA